MIPDHPASFSYPAITPLPGEAYISYLIKIE